MNRTLFIFLGISIALSAIGQDDIEKYMLKDSLQIQALIGDQGLLDEEKEGFNISMFSKIGLSGRQLITLNDLNASLDTLGYGRIPEAGLGWTFGNQIDLGDRLSLGYTYLSNIFLSDFIEGDNVASRYTYFTFTLDVAYRSQFIGLQLVPGIGLGFSQSYLAMKPTKLEAISWNELHSTSDLITSVGQTDFALSFDLSVGKYLKKENGTKSLLSLKSGVLFHPFSFGDPGITSGEFNFVDITDMPEMKSSSFYITLTWGFPQRSE